MTINSTDPQFVHRLVATPHGEFYILYIDPEHPTARKRFSLNMTIVEVFEHCQTQWPGRYSGSEVDRLAQVAVDRRHNPRSSARFVDEGVALN
jgi:hypothetical protein